MRHETSERSMKAGSKFTRLKFRGLKEQAKYRLQILDNLMYVAPVPVAQDFLDEPSPFICEDYMDTPTVLRKNPGFYEQHPEIFQEEDCYA